MFKFLSVILILFLPIFSFSQERLYLYTNGAKLQGLLQTHSTIDLNPYKCILRLNTTNNIGVSVNYKNTISFNVLTSWLYSLFIKILGIILFISILLVFYFFWFLRLKKQKGKLEQKVAERTMELTEANVLLKERQEEITIQNEELAFHRYQLEKIVDERTAELEQALQRAEESDRLKSAFLANMSHEIRTPMNAIVGFSYLIRDNSITTEERIEYIDIINSNCESLLVLINDIIDISKIESNQIDIAKKQFNLIPVLEELENVYNLQKKHQIEIKYIRNDEFSELIINCDAVRIKQVLQNLIDNAIKFTENGHIHFGYDVLPDKIEFYVNDTGIGINEKDFNQVFNSFNKLETNNNKLYRGAGLGLAISKKIVDLLEGNIWLSSKPNIGTTFYFTIPLEFNNSKIFTNKPEKPMQPLNQEIEILVAEDEPANFHLIEKILQKSKAKVIWAHNGQEAVNYVRDNLRENLLILMDIKMPVMNGIEALKQIKELDPNIPVIAVTAYAFESEKVEILKNDFNDYISKPLKPANLVEIIEKNLEKQIR